MNLTSARPTSNAVIERLGRPRLRIGAACATVFAVLALAVGRRWEPLVRADHALAGRTHDWAASQHALIRAAMLVSDVARPVTFQLAAGVIVVGLLLGRRLRLAAQLATATLVAMASGAVFKAWIHRPRPAFTHPLAHAHGWSFPSSHALTVATAISAYILLLGELEAGSRTKRAFAVVGPLVAVTVGASRVLLGVHYLSDVVAGLLLGIALSCASFEVWRLNPAD